MSQANVEIAERGIDAFNRRDVEAFAEVTALDFEWFPACLGLSRATATEESRALKRTSGKSGRPGRHFRYSLTSVAISMTAYSRSVGPRDGAGAVAFRSMRRWQWFSTFVAARFNASSPISITVKRCWRRAVRGQVPVSGARPSPARARHECFHGDAGAAPHFRLACAPDDGCCSHVKVNPLFGRLQ
jgi:hypothetical protein